MFVHRAKHYVLVTCTRYLLKVLKHWRRGVHRAKHYVLVTCTRYLLKVLKHWRRGVVHGAKH